MARRVLAAWLAVALVAAAAAIGQTIEGPDEVTAGRPAWYQLSELGEGQTATFIPSPEIEAGPPHVRDGHALFWSDEPGSYTVVAIVSTLTIDWDAHTHDLQWSFATKVVRVTGEGPDPDPPPPPPPGKRYLTVIYEQAERTPKLANLLSRLRLDLVGTQHELAIFDRHAQGPIVPSYLSHLEDPADLPALFIGRRNASGMADVLFAGKLPATAEAVMALVKQYGG